jgi:hypothetical protein
MKLKSLGLLGLVLIAGIYPSSAQDARGQICLHGSSELPAQRTRREQSLRLARALNREESRFAIMSTPRYRPLNELPNLPPTPSGFAVRLYTDGPRYTFSLKDTLDACRYAIFSDQDQSIYEGTPSNTGAVVLPVGSN